MISKFHIRSAVLNFANPTADSKSAYCAKLAHLAKLLRRNPPIETTDKSFHHIVSDSYIPTFRFVNQIPTIPSSLFPEPRHRIHQTSRNVAPSWDRMKIRSNPGLSPAFPLYVYSQECSSTKTLERT